MGFKFVVDETFDESETTNFLKRKEELGETFVYIIGDDLHQAKEFETKFWQLRIDAGQDRCNMNAVVLLRDLYSAVEKFCNFWGDKEHVIYVFWPVHQFSGNKIKAIGRVLTFSVSGGDNSGMEGKVCFNHNGMMEFDLNSATNLEQAINNLQIHSVLGT